MGGMVRLDSGGWVTRPPEQCGNGHPFRPGDVTSYYESWIGCWCGAAVGADDDRPGHSTYECKACGHVSLQPPCTNPDAKVDGRHGSSHGH